MKKLTHLASLVVAITVGTMTPSCETIIDVELPAHEPSLVLNSFFGTDTTFLVSLHQDRYILDRSYEYTPISNAVVDLYHGEQLLGTLTEHEHERGVYELNVRPEPGVDYTIRAHKNGFTSVSATDLAPARQSNPEIKDIVRTSNRYGDMVYHLTYSLDDQPGEDYYEMLLYIYRTQYEYYSDEDTFYQYPVGEIKERIYYEDLSTQLNDFEDSRNPGIFSDELFEGKTHSRTVEIYDYFFRDNMDPEEPIKFLMEVSHLSNAYFRYAMSRQLQEDTDGNPFAEAAPVYNNITNGYGIFAGYSREATRYDYYGK